MKRTAEERKADDRDSVRSNIDSMGPHGALLYATKRLAELPHVNVRRILLLTMKAAIKRLDQDVAHGRRMAAIHARHLREAGIKVPASYLILLALAAPAAAQGTTRVYTNVVDGQPRRDVIVVVERPARPAAPVPASIQTTRVLPRNYKVPLGPTSYVPPTRVSSTPDDLRPSRPSAPWYVNGIYVGESPSGNWMSTSIGRPIVDVRIIDTPRRPR